QGVGDRRGGAWPRTEAGERGRRGSFDRLGVPARRGPGRGSLRRHLLQPPGSGRHGTAAPAAARVVAAAETRRPGLPGRAAQPWRRLAGGLVGRAGLRGDPVEVEERLPGPGGEGRPLTTGSRAPTNVGPLPPIRIFIAVRARTGRRN